MELESWQVREGFIDSFAALEKILFEESYKDAEGIDYYVMLVVQDAMGHRTSEVYDPSSGAFLGNGPSLENPTTRHRATVLDDGTILITGGANLDPTKPGHVEAQLYYVEEP